MKGLKFALQVIALVAVMFVNVHLATTGRPAEAMVLAVSVIIVGL